MISMRRYRSMVENDAPFRATALTSMIFVNVSKGADDRMP